MGGLGSQRETLVLRYVDDTIAISRRFCTTCLFLRLQKHYPSKLTWELVSSGTQLRWLLFEINPTQHGNIGIGIAKQELDWLTGKRQTPERFRLAPCVGSNEYFAAELVSFLRRWRDYTMQFDLCNVASQEAAYNALAIAVRSDYPPQQIERCIRKLYTDAASRQAMLIMLSTACAQIEPVQWEHAPGPQSPPPSDINSRTTWRGVTGARGTAGETHSSSNPKAKGRDAGPTATSGLQATPAGNQPGAHRNPAELA